MSFWCHAHARSRYAHFRSTFYGDKNVDKKCWHFVSVTQIRDDVEKNRGPFKHNVMQVRQAVREMLTSPAIAWLVSQSFAHTRLVILICHYWPLDWMISDWSETGHQCIFFILSFSSKRKIRRSEKNFLKIFWNFLEWQNLLVSTVARKQSLSISIVPLRQGFPDSSVLWWFWWWNPNLTLT